MRIALMTTLAAGCFSLSALAAEPVTVRDEVTVVVLPEGQVAAVDAVVIPEYGPHVVKNRLLAAGDEWQEGTLYNVENLHDNDTDFQYIEQHQNVAFDGPLEQ